MCLANAMAPKPFNIVCAFIKLTDKKFNIVIFDKKKPVTTPLESDSHSADFIMSKNKRYGILCALSPTLAWTSLYLPVPLSAPMYYVVTAVRREGTGRCQ